MNSAVLWMTRTMDKDAALFASKVLCYALSVFGFYAWALIYLPIQFFLALLVGCFLGLLWRVLYVTKRDINRLDERA